MEWSKTSSSNMPRHASWLWWEIGWSCFWFSCIDLCTFQFCDTERRSCFWPVAGIFQMTVNMKIDITMPISCLLPICSRHLCRVVVAEFPIAPRTFLFKNDFWKIIAWLPFKHRTGTETNALGIASIIDNSRTSLEAVMQKRYIYIEHISRVTMLVYQASIRF